ncbi:lysine decarboxylase domain-containing protein [Angomonas deanei]|nr:lysine decarboxylase domain-containing protein [Angomonas deanei]|eukprot:EPY24647.1 lysine decarboxylase domain-containing protein [Angomonas deanei]
MADKDKNSPYIQKEGDSDGKGLKRTIKSYKNESFLNSHDGRLVRIVCEFEEPRQRLKRNYIRSTVLVFGSARAMTTAQHAQTKHNLEKQLEAASAQPGNEQQVKDLQSQLVRLESLEWMCPWVGKCEEVARRIALFAKENPELINKSFNFIPDYFQMNYDEIAKLEEDDVSSNVSTPSTASVAETMSGRFCDLVVTTGGGPGFMEAANKGAASVRGTKTMGMGISLPFEKGLNPFVSDDLAFEFHYFFTRKFWMMYSCRAIIVAPGGFGTLDEMFELLTLRQTKKIPTFPVVLLGESFWKTVINWQALADYGVISQHEIDSLCFTDSAEEAVAFIKQFYVNLISQ